MDTEQKSDREDESRDSEANHKARTEKVKNLFDYFEANPRAAMEKYEQVDPVS